MPDGLDEVDPPDAYSVRVGSGVSGHVVCGNNNVVITAGRDSSITVGAAGPPPIRKRTRPVARPMPRPGGPLAGRDGELSRIDQALDEGRPVHVSGPSGCGKSALLRHVAARRADAGDDVVFLPAAGLDVQDVLQELFQACYAAEDYRPEPDRLRRLMGSVRALVVVDDFGGSAQDFASLLDACPACDLVVASRDQAVLAPGDPLAVTLAGLTETDVRQLLAGELARPLRTDELRAAHELWQASNGNPRALVQAVAAVRVLSTASAEQTVGLRAAPAVIASAVAARLTPAAGEVLGLLSMLPGIDVPWPCLAALAGAEPRPAAITELTETRLVSGGPAGYRVAGGLATLVAERLAVSPDVAALAPNLVSWVRGAATLRQVAEAAPVIRRVLALGVEHDHHAAVVELARIVAPVLQRTLRWGSWREVLAVGRASAARTGSAVDEAYFAHEENIRRRALGRAAVAGTLLGAAAIAGQASSTDNVPEPDPGVAVAPGVGKLGSTAAKPLTVLGTAVVTIGVVVGGIMFANRPTPTETADRGHGVPVAVTTTTTTPTTYSEQGPPTGGTGARPPEPAPEEPPVPVQNEPPPPQPPVDENPSDPGGCTAGANPELDFGTVPYGEENTRGFDLSVRVEQCWPPEGAATADMWIEGEGFELNPRDPAQCPSPTRANGSDVCTFAVTFRPTRPDRTDYTATLYIPVAAGQGEPGTYLLVGTATA